MYGRYVKYTRLENMAIANALQLEAARRTPVLNPFNNIWRHAKFEVAEPIRCLHL